MRSTRTSSPRSRAFRKKREAKKKQKKKGDDDGEKDVETGLAALAARLPELARVVATCGKARGGEGVEGGGDDDA